MELKAAYSRDDLLSAFLKLEESRRCHPDIVDYYTRQVWALGRALDPRGVGLDLTTVPRERAHLGMIFGSAVDAYVAAQEPWPEVLTGSPPPSVSGLASRHRLTIAEACAHMRDAYGALLLDLLEAIWEIGPDRSASLGQVQAHGFDPAAPALDLDLYW